MNQIGKTAINSSNDIRKSYVKSKLYLIAIYGKLWSVKTWFLAEFTLNV